MLVIDPLEFAPDGHLVKTAPSYTPQTIALP